MICDSFFEFAFKGRRICGGTPITRKSGLEKNVSTPVYISAVVHLTSRRSKDGFKRFYNFTFYRFVESSQDKDFSSRVCND